ncbi:hypothetical protein [Caballeronia sp. RCC_10]|uniref:hypothetical protein n=1 Tax=Caballeronia sp. RCC_10 TaxID=3239227 RepID=UPI003524FB77
MSEGSDGFSVKDDTGRWTGMDADFCRAVAAAALGDPAKVAYVPLKASARFPALARPWQFWTRRRVQSGIRTIDETVLMLIAISGSDPTSRTGRLGASSASAF